MEGGRAPHEKERDGENAKHGSEFHETPENPCYSFDAGE